MRMIEGIAELGAAAVLVADGADRLATVPVATPMPGLAEVAYRAWQVTMALGTLEVAGAAWLLGLVLLAAFEPRPAATPHPAAH